MKIKIDTYDYKLYCATNDAALLRWFKGSKVVDANNNPLVVYHGSSAKFDKFLHEHIGIHGTSEGKGFYFTSNKSIAQGYSGKDGHLYSVYLKIKKPLNYTKKTITRAKLTQFIMALEEYNKQYGESFLSNYGDIEYEGLNKVLRYAVDCEYSSSTNDVDLIHSIMNGSGYSNTGNSIAEFTSLLTKTLGYDGIIVRKPDWGDQTLYIVFESNQIKSVTSNFDNTDNINK